MLTFQFVPNICANGVVHLVDRGMIAHVEFDLIDDSVIAEIDEKDFWRRISQHELSVSGCAHERILNAIGWGFVVDANANPHRVHLSRVMQVDDGFPDDFVVWNVEVNTVVCTQAGGAPVDLHDFGEAIAHLQPVAYLVGPANLQRDAGKDSAEYQVVLDRLKRKFANAPKYLPKPVITAMGGNDVGIVSVGSCDGAIREALDVLRRQKIEVDYLRVKAFPFNNDVETFLKSHSTIFVVEQNRDAQLKSLLTLETAVEKSKLFSILSYSGFPMSAEPIVNGIRAKLAEAPRLTAVPGSL